MGTPGRIDNSAGTGARPRLVYDGNCGLCGYWVRYWKQLTGDAVEYRPFQEVAAQYPTIALADFQSAVQYITPDGQCAGAAEASFLTLSHARGKGIWLALYRNVPGFAALSELVYAFIAAHRSAFYRVSLFLWGRDFGPSRYELVSFLFLRLFGLIYFSAFVSFGIQAQGLIGSHGILPLHEFVDAVHAQAGPERFFLMPMVFWWNASDSAIHSVCWVGAGLSLLLVFNVLPRVFVEMPAGRAVGTVFFALLVLAALMPSVALLEPIVAWVVQRWAFRRASAVLVIGGSAWVLGLGSVLSFNDWEHWHPLSFVPLLANKTFFDLMDYLSSNIMLPIGALLTSVFVGWRLSAAVMTEELAPSPTLARFACRWLLRYACPMAILAVFIATLI